MPKNTSLQNVTLVFLLLLNEAGGTSAVSALQTGPLPIEETIRTRSFVEDSPLAFSPDGEWISYVLRDDTAIRADEETFVRTGIPARSYGGKIWIVNRKTGENQTISEYAGSSWDPTWSPDGHYLAFLADRRGNGEARLWLWDARQRESRMLSPLRIKNEYPMNRMLWTPDSRNILSTTVPEPTLAAGTSVAVSQVSGVPQAQGPTVTVYESGRMFAADNDLARAPMFDLDSVYLRDLSLIEVATGRSITLVHGQRIGWYVLSPEGLRIAYAIPKRFDRPGSYQRVYDLAVVFLATKRVQVIAADLLLDDVLSWSPSGTLISFGAYDGLNSYSYYVVQGDGGALRKIAALPYHPYSGGFPWMPLWDSSGEHFYFLFNGALWKASVSRREAVECARIPDRLIVQRISQSMGRLWTIEGGKTTVVITHDREQKRDGFYRVDLTSGESTVLLEKGACYTCKLSSDVDSYDVAVSSDGKYVAFTAQDAQHPPNLIVSDVTFLNPKQLSRLNPQFDNYEMGSVRVISWLSDEGDRLQGALLLPPDYNPGQKLPLIVWVYPGASLSDYLDRFGMGEFPGPLNLQLFATRGYAVLLPDSPDKTVDRFSNLAGSVLPGVDRVIEMGIADPARIGVMGHSQGGYGTLALIVQTKRFRAAMAADGWGDFTSYYGLMQKDGTGYQYGQAELQLGGPPWQYPMRYVQSSPIFYLDRVDTPLLIVHGSQDDGHPSFLADEIFVGLRRLGKTVKYAKYEGEGHSPRDWKFANQLDLAKRVIAWFGSHLKGPVN